MWTQIATLWGILGGLGMAIDMIVLRKRHKRIVYLRLTQFWLRIRRTKSRRLARLLAIATLRRLRPVLYKRRVKIDAGTAIRWRISWTTLLLSASSSCLLTVGALAIGLLNSGIFRPEDIGSILLKEGVRLTILYILGNLPFDMFTIWVTLWALGVMCRVGMLAALGIVVLDFSIAVCLGMGANAVGDLLTFGAPRGLFYEIMSSCVQALQGLAWVLGWENGVDWGEHLISFLYAATTLIPTTLFLTVLVAALFAKPVAVAGKQFALHVLAATREYPDSPETLPVATMVAALLGLLSTAGLIAYRIPMYIMR